MYIVQIALLFTTFASTMIHLFNSRSYNHLIYFTRSFSTDDFSNIRLPDGWRDFDVYSKCKLVIALVTNNGAFFHKSRQYVRHYTIIYDQLQQFIKGTKKACWQFAIRPVWWPESIPFGDPNNSRPRLSAAQLHSIIAGYSSYMVASDVATDDVNVGGSVDDVVDSVNDRVDDIVDNAADVDGVDDVVNSVNDVVDNVIDDVDAAVDDEVGDDEVGDDDDGDDEDGVDGDVEDSADSPGDGDAVSGMINVLKVNQPTHWLFSRL